MEILARFAQNKFDHTKSTDTHLVVTLKAPTLDWVQKRPALCVVPVVDLSGSMSGEKLTYAKKSLMKLIDHLQEGDVAGLIAFESRVHTLVSPQEVTSALKTTLRKAVEDMRVMGGTNFSDGLLKAIEAVQSLDLAPKYLKRVIMFTDGQPTEGVTDCGQIVRLLGERRGSVTVSAFGYGDSRGGTYNGCDLDFLTKMSEDGAGNFAYVKDPDDALAAFGKELGGLLSTYATDLDVEVEPVQANVVSKVVTDASFEEDTTGTYNVSVANILSEETRHFVFGVKLAQQDKVLPRAVSVFSVRVKYSVVAEDGSRETKTIETKARAQFVRPADVAKAEEDREVGEVIKLHEMTRAQRDAEELAKKGSFQEAESHMQAYAASAAASGYGHIAEAARTVGTRMRSRNDYATSGGFLRSMSLGASRGYGVSSMDAEAALALNNVGSVNLNNSAMDSMVTSFTEASAPAVPEAAPAVASMSLPRRGARPSK